MDWLLTTAETALPGGHVGPGGPGGHVGPGAPAAEKAVRSGAPRHSAQGDDPGRLDLAVARAVERQTENVLAGVQVAALFGAEGSLNTGAVLPGGSPTWLSADLDLLVQLVRLSAAAGVVLPHGVAGAPGAERADPEAQLAASRDCYRDVIGVLSMMSVSDEIPPTCRDDALRLLRQAERRVHHLDEDHPAMRDRTRPESPYEHEFIPGELLG